MTVSKPGDLVVRHVSESDTLTLRRVVDEGDEGFAVGTEESFGDGTVLGIATSVLALAVEVHEEGETDGHCLREGRRIESVLLNGEEREEEVDERRRPVQSRVPSCNGACPECGRQYSRRFHHCCRG